MNKILLNQLQKLATAHFNIDNGQSTNLLEDFSEVVFYKKTSQNKTTKIVFEDYIINPSKNFDFHDKWNNGNVPKCKTMYGRITKETSGMYYFCGSNESGEYEWNGWVPKKSCTISEVCL